MMSKFQSRLALGLVTAALAFGSKASLASEFDDLLLPEQRCSQIEESSMRSYLRAKAAKRRKPDVIMPTGFHGWPYITGPWVDADQGVFLNIDVGRLPSGASFVEVRMRRLCWGSSERNQLAYGRMTFSKSKSALSQDDLGSLKMINKGLDGLPSYFELEVEPAKYDARGQIQAIAVRMKNGLATPFIELELVRP